MEKGGGTIHFPFFKWGGGRKEVMYVRRGQTTACTGQKDLAERGLSLLILGIVVVHLELHEEAVRREEHPVQQRGSSLFMAGVADPSDQRPRSVQL